MKSLRFLLLIITWIFLSNTCFAIEAGIQIYKFRGPALPYVEINTHYIGKSITMFKIDSIAHQARVQVTTLFLQDNKIVKADKYLLNGPVSAFPADFIDVKRYSLAQGEYRLMTHIVDLNDTTNVLNSAVDFTINFVPGKSYFSDVELLSEVSKTTQDGPMVKNGFYMEPLPGNFYSRYHSALFAYLEIYDISLKNIDAFKICSYVETTGKSAAKLEAYTSCKSYRYQKIVPVIIQKNILKLASGNYNLVIELRDTADNILFDKKVYFQRSNPMVDIATMQVDQGSYEKSFAKGLQEQEVQYSLRALGSIVPPTEVEVLNSIIAMKDNEGKRKYLFNFWTKYDPLDTEKSYQKYMKLAKEVDAAYASGFGYGFETDRGRIWLKYGPPNDKISIEEDPNAPPYEIWVYNDFPKTQQRNVKFLFYNPNLGNDYILLHSNCRIEINNPRWLKELYKGAKSNYNSDDYQESGQIKDGFLKHASDYFNDL